MPELPDIVVYLDALQPRIVGQTLEHIRLFNPFVLRSFEPDISEAERKQVVSLRRLGKRIVIQLQDNLFIIIHLMIAGRFLWKAPGAKPPGKIGLAAFDFPSGSLIFTEAGTKRRASLRLVRGEADLAKHNPGGLEIMTASEAEFAAALRRENHTLKRTLTDPHTFSGIGNSYSDEILHRAGLSPFAQSQKLNDADVAKLFHAIQATMSDWIDRLRKQAGDKFPEKVTAFRPEMAVHGRFGQPCPTCGTKVQRIRYADNETNYCPKCQTAGKVLADRSLSRLLKNDWPKTIDDLE